MTRVAIVGATGYVGMEIVRLLHGRQDIEITCVVSNSFSGKPFSAIYPAFSGLFDMPCVSLDKVAITDKADFFILALPHGVSGDLVPHLLQNGKKVIDHSADFRFRELSDYHTAYNVEHPAPDLLKEAVYGLPELYREKLKNARIVGDPGCYPTCSILGILPALKAGIASSKGITINAASGISGAGRKADLPYSFCESDATMKPYGVQGHRHTPEIEQELSLIAGTPVAISFVPHLVPMKRGMLATIHMDATRSMTPEAVHEIYASHYQDEPFVRVLPLGKFPETRFVSGSNFIDIGVWSDERTGHIIVVSALDNLGKGSASQAIQAMNLMCGYHETAGLLSAAHTI